MKRFSLLLLTCTLVLAVAGCAQDKEKQLSDHVESELRTIERQLERAAQAKTTLESNLKGFEGASDQLRQEIAAMRNSIAQLNTSLDDIQRQITDLSSAQRELRTKTTGGFLRWLIIIVVVAVIVVLGVKMLRSPKPFDEDEEEDFSAFDEELGYEEPDEEVLGLDGDKGPDVPKPGS